MTQKQNILTKTGIVALLACVCCVLWGSAIPVIKTGYNLMQVDSADTASQIVFAGIRFTLAGILVLIFASVRERKIMLPNREILKYAVPVCLAQTVGQYFFFYIGVAHTSGVKGGIITGLGNFIAILLSCLVFRNERMTGRKIAGCILGFAGVVVINFLWNLHCADQYFFQKSISGSSEWNTVYNGRHHIDFDWCGHGRTSWKCCSRGNTAHTVSGNGLSSSIHTLVCAACME